MPLEYRAGEPLTCQQIREVDVLAIEHVGLPGIVLMENAGREAANFIYDKLPNPRHGRVLILCGAGNNGGDGFVVARHLRNGGVPVEVALAVPEDKLSGDAALNAQIWRRMNQPILDASNADRLDETASRIENADLVIDALLGTGATGAPRPPMDRLIQLANAAARPRRIAIDIPSGLNGDSGAPADPCFRADATLTFVASKVGFEAPSAAPFVGLVRVLDIGAPRALIPGSTQIWPGT